MLVGLEGGKPVALGGDRLVERTQAGGDAVLPGGFRHRDEYFFPKSGRLNVRLTDAGFGQRPDFRLIQRSVQHQVAECRIEALLFQPIGDDVGRGEALGFEAKERNFSNESRAVGPV